MAQLFFIVVCVIFCVTFFFKRCSLFGLVCRAMQPLIVINCVVWYYCSRVKCIFTGVVYISTRRVKFLSVIHVHGYNRSA